MKACAGTWLLRAQEGLSHPFLPLSEGPQRPLATVGPRGLAQAAFVVKRAKGGIFAFVIKSA